MNQTLLFDGKTYISVGRASKKLGYTADYIGQLCRAGKIDARMIGRTWYVEWESIKNHKKNKKHRVRRTAEEIKKARQTEMSYSTSGGEVDVLEKQKDKDCPDDEYLQRVDEVIAKEKEADKTPEFVQPISNLIPLSAVEDNKSESITISYPSSEYLNNIDAALPIKYSYDLESEWLPKLSKKLPIQQTDKKVVSLNKYNPIFAGALSLFIFFNILFIGTSLVSPAVNSHSIARSIDNALNIFDGENNLAISDKNLNTSNTSFIYGGAGEVWDFLFGSITKKINRFATKYMNSLGFALKTDIQQEPTPLPKTPITRGMAVLPDDKDHETRVASIKKTFSDEVEIKEDPDGESGVITPRFREADGEGYTYVLIPIDSP